MYFKILFASFLSFVFLTSCGNSGGGGSGGPAKPAASKESTKRVTTSLSAIENVLSSKTNKVSTKQFSVLNINKMSSSNSGENGPGVEKVTNNINKILDTSKCKFDIPVDQNPSKPPSNNQGQSIEVNIDDMFAEIGGPDCPLEAKIIVKATKKEDLIDADFSLSMIAKTEEMKKELGLSSAKIQGKILVSIEKTEQKMIMNGKMTFNGSGESLSDGPFTLVHNITPMIAINMGSQNSNPPQPGGEQPDLSQMFSMKFSENQVIDFTDTKTTLSSEMTMKGMDVTAQYFINGNEVSAQEYQEYVSQINYPGLNGPQQGDQSGGTSPTDSAMFCSVRIYNAYEVPLSLLVQSLNDQTILNAQPIGGLGSCGKNQSQEAYVDGKLLKYSLIFDFEKVTASVSRGSLSNKLYGQNEDETRVAAQTDDVTWALECFPVQQCH